MKRRDFLKGLSLITIGALFPTQSFAKSVDISKVSFSSDIYNNNNAQCIMIFLYGGASELGANLTNIDEIQEKSQNKYNLNNVTSTENGFWEQAGGDAMERMLANEDMNLFRTCYRKDNTSKSHGECIAENQRGLMDIENPFEGPGIFSTLGKVLTQNSAISEETMLPFLTMEGESGFFNKGNLNIDSFLRPAGINENLDNPYARSLPYETYTKDEWDSNPRPSDTAFSAILDTLAKSINKETDIQTALEKRALLDNFIEEQNNITIPDGIEYPNTSFAKKLKTAVNILSTNDDTKVISLGGGGLGGWDDHSNAISQYTSRKSQLMEAIEVSLSHLKANNKTNVNIIVFSDFGRNVNLNDSAGWDHGNNQNVFIFGGSDYFNKLGIVGETQLKPTESNNRLYSEPTEDSYTFEPYSVAATIYKMFGVTNPEVLTDGYKAIEANLFK